MPSGATLLEHRYRQGHRSVPHGDARCSTNNWEARLDR